MDGSPPLSMSGADWKKVGKGLGIAMAGSGLAYLGQNLVPGLSAVHMGWLAPFVAVLVNTALKFVSDTQQGQ